MTAHRGWTRSISSKDRDFISGNGINEVDIALSLCYYNKNGVEEDMVSSVRMQRDRTYAESPVIQYFGITTSEQSANCVCKKVGREKPVTA